MNDTRPSWDDIFMEIAFVFRKRSPDPTTRHGSLLVSQDKTEISLGYNGYPAGCHHDKMPKDRSRKYLITIHSESNAIDNAGFKLKGATLYVTGYPCHLCWQRIINKKIIRVVYGPVQSKCVDEQSRWASDLMLENQDILVEEYKGPFLQTMLEELSCNQLPQNP